MIKEIKELEKDIFKKAFIFSLLPFLGGFLLKSYFFSVGIIIGLLSGFLNFHLLSLKVNRTHSLQVYIFFLNYIIRYLIMACVLILTAIFNKGLFLGAAIGILMPQFTIFLKRWELNKYSR